MTAACAVGRVASATTSSTAAGGDVVVTEGPSAASGPGSGANGQGIPNAKLALAQALGLDAKDLSRSAATPSSPQADVVLEWAGGTAEVDSRSGLVYSIAVRQVAASTTAQSLNEEGLKYQALQMVATLGWTKGMLDGLGFRQEQPGVVSSDGSIYSLTWSQYDDKGLREDGRVEVRLDRRTSALVGLSVSLATQGVSIAGSISESEAMGIAQTTVFLRTIKPKITLAGDGSLLLAGGAVLEKLVVVNDHKITKDKPVLMWVITITGTVDSQKVGGTVYIDAKTGAVLNYVSQQVTTTTTTTIP